MNCCELDRRTLLRAGAAAAAATVVAEGVSTRYAFAAEPVGKAGSTGDTLVVLSLRGGFDGLSAVVPHGDPDYYKARPSIAVPNGRRSNGSPAGVMFSGHLYREGDLIALAKAWQDAAEPLGNPPLFAVQG